MRSIAKGPEPASLTTHRNMPHCDYDNYADKDTLRAALVADQRGLCRSLRAGGNLVLKRKLERPAGKQG